MCAEKHRARIAPSLPFLSASHLTAPPCLQARMHRFGTQLPPSCALGDPLSATVCNASTAEWTDGIEPDYLSRRAVSNNSHRAGRSTMGRCGLDTVFEDRNKQPSGEMLRSRSRSAQIPGDELPPSLPGHVSSFTHRPRVTTATCPHRPRATTATCHRGHVLPPSSSAMRQHVSA